MSKSKWDKEILLTTDRKESQIEEVKSGKNNYYYVTMKNGDTASVYKQAMRGLSEGMVVTYQIEKFRLTNTDTGEQLDPMSSFVKIRPINKGRGLSMLQGISPEQVIFFDIETASIEEKLLKSSPYFESWEYKMKRRFPDKELTTNDLKSLFLEHASLYPCFLRVCCVSLGRISDKGLTISSYFGENEEEILSEVGEIIDKIDASKTKYYLCGHSIKGFDIPVLMRRYLINGINVPGMFDVAGKKPWDLDAYVLDTSDIFKGTAFNHESLLNIATAMGLPSPKDDIDGSEVSKTFYKGDVDRIARYCEKDVHTVSNVMLRMMGQPFIDGYNSVVFDKTEES